jgi:hypothetical protein
MGYTLLLIVGVVGGLPGSAYFLARSSASLAAVPFQLLTWLSPTYPFVWARETLYVTRPVVFWGTLLASHLVGWIFLVVASVVLPYVWQKEKSGFGDGGWLQRRRVRRRTSAARSRARRQALAEDPVLWLLGDAPRLRLVVWAIVGLWGLVVFRCWAARDASLVTYRGAHLCALLLKMFVAFQACRFFAEARQSGALELLLCTPVRNAVLIKTQWHALRRVFLWPMALFLALASFLVLAATPLASAIPSVAVAQTDVLGLPAGAGDVGMLMLRLFADTLAVGWFGMWLSLTMKRSNLAIALTILLVLLLPCLLYPFDIVADMLFISWGTTRLQRDFRYLLHGFTQPETVRAIARPPPIPVAPPVLINANHRAASHASALLGGGSSGGGPTGA